MDKKQSTTTETATPISWSYQPGLNGSGFPWAPHKIPVSLHFEGISLAMEKCEGGMCYRRENGSDGFEKMVLAEKVT